MEAGLDAWRGDRYSTDALYHNSQSRQPSCCRRAAVTVTSSQVVVRRRRGAVDGRPLVFWRPGCGYCLRLRLRLGRRARLAHWVNIWRDPAAAAAVGAVNDGNETVPTVVVAGRPYTNPDPAWVRERLHA